MTIDCVASSVGLDVELQNPYDYQDLPSLAQLTQWANAAMQNCDANGDHQGQIVKSLVVRVVNPTEGLQLNQDYRGKAYATNILSFPFEAPPIELIDTLDIAEFSHLGDLVICEPVLRKEAQQQNKTLLQHWAHLLVHGVLHLQGFDHISDAEAEIMESLEVKILEKLGFTNPYH